MGILDLLNDEEKLLAKHIHIDPESDLITIIKDHLSRQKKIITQQRIAELNSDPSTIFANMIAVEDYKDAAAIQAEKDAAQAEKDAAE